MGGGDRQMRAVRKRVPPDPDLSTGKLQLFKRPAASESAVAQPLKLQRQVGLPQGNAGGTTAPGRREENCRGGGKRELCTI